MNDKKLKVELRPLDELIPYELNAKVHDPEQVAKIAKSIQQFGWDVPIVVDRHGVIIKGHGRRLAALELGLEKVPVLVRDDLTPAQVAAARLADNRVAISAIDSTKLRADLSALDYDLSGIFDDKELEFLDANLGEMRTEAFLDDMDATVADQKRDLDQRLAAAGAALVPLYKAFGFKEIPAGGQLLITQLMAVAEAKTGKKDGEALVEFLKTNLAHIEQEAT